jgi:hypothetical protein
MRGFESHLRRVCRPSRATFLSSRRCPAVMFEYAVDIMRDLDPPACLRTSFFIRCPPRRKDSAHARGLGAGLVREAFI